MLNTIIPFCYESSKDFYTMSMTSIYPAWWWNGYNIVTKVDKYINEIPMGNSVASCGVVALYESGKIKISV